MSTLKKVLLIGGDASVLQFENETLGCIRALLETNTHHTSQILATSDKDLGTLAPVRDPMDIEARISLIFDILLLAATKGFIDTPQKKDLSRSYVKECYYRLSPRFRSYCPRPSWT